MCLWDYRLGWVSREQLRTVTAGGSVNIVHVSDCFLPRLGGIEVQVADLARAQHDAGHHVEVITATRGTDDGAPPFPVHRVVAPVPFELPVHPRAGRHLKRILRASAPDVVHVHVGAASPFGWSAARQAVRLGLPTVVTVHSMWDPITRALYEVLGGISGRTYSGVVVTTVSNAAASLIRQVVRGRAPVEVVSNGLEIGEWRTAPPITEESAPRDVHVVAVGRLAPRKRPIALMRLLRAVHDEVGGRVSMTATVVGDGPARAAMERYLRRHRMSWVDLPGRLPREQVLKVLAEADVFIAPAPRESFGIAALEARTAGVPVVARSRSGVADFVRPGIEGLLGDRDTDLAAAVGRLVLDESLRTTIADYNRANPPERCTWPVVLSSFSECYRQARAIARISRR